MISFKRYILVMLSLALMFSAFGCNKSNELKTSSEDSEKFTIVTSFYPMYIFAKNVANGISNVEVINMTEPQTGCLHDYQLSTDNMKALESADVFVINGAGMEGFMDKITQQMANLKVIEASKGIEFIESEHEHEKAEGEEHESDEHDINVNPHVWVGISGAIQEVKNITEQLTLIDVKNAEKYEKNSEEYIKKLEEQKNKMDNALKDLKNRDIVTFHEAFPYFAKEFNLNVVGVIEKEPGQEPSAAELVNIIKIIKEKNVKALFTEEQYSPKAADTIANETGAKVYQLDLAVTGPKEADADSYIKAMDKNLDVLLEALK